MKKIKQVATMAALAIAFSLNANASGLELKAPSTPLKLSLDGPFTVDTSDNDRDVINFNERDRAGFSELTTLSKRNVFDKQDKRDPLWE